MSQPLRQPLAKPLLQQLEQRLAELQRDPNFTGYAFAASALLLLVTFYLFRRLFGLRGPRKVLLVGLSNAGKTLCFARLVAEKRVTTVTSMQANEALVTRLRRRFLLVDVPGFDRVRAKCWEQSRPGGRALVFLVDSGAFAGNRRDVADYLYTLLADPEVLRRRMPVLVACNKQDAAGARPADEIAAELEQEMQLVRETRLAALDSTDASAGGGSRALLGRPDRPFRFGDLRCRVSFVDCACKGDFEPGMRPLCDWLGANV